MVLGVSEATVTRITGDKQAVDARLAIMLEELFNVPADIPVASNGIGFGTSSTGRRSLTRIARPGRFFW